MQFLVLPHWLHFQPWRLPFGCEAQKRHSLINRCFFPNVSLWEKVFLDPMASWDGPRSCNTTFWPLCRNRFQALRCSWGLIFAGNSKSLCNFSSFVDCQNTTGKIYCSQSYRQRFIRSQSFGVYLLIPSDLSGSQVPG